MKTILTNCTVIDCTGRPPMKDTTVVIERETIAALQPGAYQQTGREGTRVSSTWAAVTSSPACGTATPTWGSCCRIASA